MSRLSELLRPTAFGATRPSLVEDGASCFCVGTCTRRHSGSRLRRRLPSTSGLECPAPTGWTLDYHVRRMRVLAFKHQTHCSEYRTPAFEREGSKAMAYCESDQRRRAYPLPTHSLRSFVEEGVLPACDTDNLKSVANPMGMVISR